MATDPLDDARDLQPDQSGEPIESGKTKTQLQAALQVVIQRLQTEADERVSKRRVVENRWLLDLRQYYGEYDEVTTERLAATPNKSNLFLNETRPKTNACEAKIADMLFPTDDRNWGIQPTPVPQLTANAKKALDMVQKLAGQANESGVPGDPSHPLIQQANAHAATAAQLQAQLEEAKTRANGMQDEMETQLTDCNYQVESREMLHDACVIGTGVMKGPVANVGQARRQWTMKFDQITGQHTWGLSYAPDIQPAYYRVDPWGFFPDPDARKLSESEATFERHLKTRQELRDLAKQPGFDPDAIRALIKQEPSAELPTYLADLRGITGENLPPTDPRYQVWEYRGPLTAEEMLYMCQALGKDELGATIQDEEPDPLQAIQIVLWFCQDQVLKFNISHMDSGETIYSTYNLEKDASSIWGFGVPYWMRDTQKAMNGAWRMLMDNAGLCTGPQVELDPSVIEPADGEWSLAPRKLWKRRENAVANKSGIVLTDIPSHIQDLLLIINQCEKSMQAESAVTDVVMGDQGTTVQTARGTSILANAANVTFRRMIKNFDDDMTTPNIRRLYDWNMQFSDKEYIKGDMQVDARGTSVLLVRELQSENLINLLDKLPPETVAKWLKGPQLLRKTVQSMMLPADEVVESDDEIKTAEQAASSAPPPPNPDQLKAQTALQIAEGRDQTAITVANINAEARANEADLNRTTAMQTVAQTHNMQSDVLAAGAQKEQLDRQSKERILAAEAALKARSPNGAGVPV